MTTVDFCNIIKGRYQAKGKKMKYSYRTKGTCSSQISFELNDGIITNISFTGGCNGNLQGISRLVDGMKADEAMKKLSGIRCGFKNTSCPDQLARAIEAALCES